MAGAVAIGGVFFRSKDPDALTACDDDRGFARIHYPKGNPVELWQAPAA